MQSMNAWRWTPLRLIILSLTCCLTIGSYFAYDSIGASKDYLIRGLGINKFQFGLLYSVYSVPNWFMVFLAGVMIDDMGVRISSLISSGLIVAGSLLVAFAGQIASYPLMLVARFFFGIGAEAVVLGQNAFVCAWFPYNTAFALALSVALARLGTVLSFAVNPRILEKYNDYRQVLWIAAAMCIASFTCNAVLAGFDKRAGKDGTDGVADGAEKKRYKLKEMYKWSVLREVINVDAVKRFPLSFWLIVAICVMFYSSVIGLTSIVVGHFKAEWHLSGDDAGLMTSVVMFTSMLLSPGLGAAVDSFGHRPYLLIFGSMMMIPANAYLGLTRWSPLPAMILIGLAFSLVPSALWPSVSVLVPPEDVGTAFGACAALQNVGLTLSTLIIGAVDDRWNFDGVAVVLVAYDAMAVAAAIWLLYDDRKHGGLLQMTAAEREARKDTAKQGLLDGEDAVPVKAARSASSYAVLAELDVPADELETLATASYQSLLLPRLIAVMPLGVPSRWPTWPDGVWPWLHGMLSSLPPVAVLTIAVWRMQVMPSSLSDSARTAELMTIGATALVRLAAILAAYQLTWLSRRRNSKSTPLLQQVQRDAVRFGVGNSISTWDRFVTLCFLVLVAMSTYSTFQDLRILPVGHLQPVPAFLLALVCAFYSTVVYVPLAYSALLLMSLTVVYGNLTSSIRSSLVSVLRGGKSANVSLPDLAKDPGVIYDDGMAAAVTSLVQQATVRFSALRVLLSEANAKLAVWLLAFTGFSLFRIASAVMYLVYDSSPDGALARSSLSTIVASLSLLAVAYAPTVAVTNAARLLADAAIDVRGFFRPEVPGGKDPYYAAIDNAGDRDPSQRIRSDLQQFVVYAGSVCRSTAFSVAGVPVSAALFSSLAAVSVVPLVVLTQRAYQPGLFALPALG